MIVGGKNSAAEAALDLYRAGASVTLVHRGAALGESISLLGEARHREPDQGRIGRRSLRHQRPGDTSHRSRRRDRRAVPDPSRPMRSSCSPATARTPTRCCATQTSISIPKPVVPCTIAPFLIPNMPRSTACRSPSSRAAAQPKTPSLARSHPRPRPGSRIACEITFPRLLGYRYDVGGERLTVTSPPTRGWRSRPPTFPRRPRTPPSSGRSSIHTLDDLKRHRPNEVAFLLAKLTLETLLPRRRRQRQALALPAAAPHRQALARRMRHAQGPHLPATAAAD